MQLTTQRFLVPVAVVLTLVARTHGAEAAPTVPDGFGVEVMTNDVTQPASIAFLPDGRLLIVEQRSGKVRLLRGTSVTTIGTVPSVNSSANERGLLGIAVDPQWPTHPYVYVHYTASSDPHVHISRFRVSGDLSNTGAGTLTMDVASRYDLVNDIPDNQTIHNGGTVRFGPDGKLYDSIGEDSSPCVAQDKTVLGGKILRLDVSRLPDGPGTATRALVTPSDNPFVTNSDPDARLVWAWGLRNPFRLQIDPQTGVAYVTDVGEDGWEELDRLDQGGLDFGWPMREGPVSHGTSCASNLPAQTEPIWAYSHAAEEDNLEALAIMNAGVYRDRSNGTGAARFPAGYSGNVFVSDYYVGHMWRLVGSNNSWSLAPAVAGQPSAEHWGEGFSTVSDYALGPDGALWYCQQFVGGFSGPGEIGRVIAENHSTPPPNPTPMPPIAMLSAVYPQPSAASATLPFTLAQQARVDVKIYDLRGRRVRELVEPETRAAGSYAEIWDGLDDDGRKVDAGLYFVRLGAGGHQYEWRVVIAR
jgi:glucose/arabinose dehydrogenase